MPLPAPHKKDTRSAFVSRCMSNTNIQKDFDTQEQRLGVCYNLYKKKESKASSVITTADDVYLYTILPEDEEKNPLDDSKDNSDNLSNAPIPPKQPDKWPSEAPKALDDTPTPKNMRASDFMSLEDYKKNNPNIKKIPSLHGPGINPNPDNSDNFPIKQGGNWEKPTINDQKWFLALTQDYYIPDPDIEKIKEWYISSIDSMPIDNFDANWPLSFDKIEKDFDRPNKEITPEVKLKDKQSEENRNTEKIHNEDKPFSLYFDK